MDINEVNNNVTEELVENAVETVTNDGNGTIQTVIGVGVIGSLSVLAWEFGIKPGIRFLKRKVKSAKAKRAAKKPKETDEDTIEVPEELPDIEG